MVGKRRRRGAAWRGSGGDREETAVAAAGARMDEDGTFWPAGETGEEEEGQRGKTVRGGKRFPIKGTKKKGAVKRGKKWWGLAGK